MNHKCYVRGCQTKIEMSMLMCGPHWKLVPRTMQDDIWREWRKVQASRRDDPTYVLHDEYIAAINAARAAVQERLDV